MIAIIFKDTDLKELYETGINKKYKKYSKDALFLKRLRLVINTIKAQNYTDELLNISFLHYEQLKENLSGYYSVRIFNNRVERLIFTQNDNKIEITLLELDNTHYGNKK